MRSHGLVVLLLVLTLGLGTLPGSVEAAESYALVGGTVHPVSSEPIENGTVLVRDGRIAGVIDWGDVTSGDPASDLASIWMLFEDPGARSHLVERLARDEALLLRARAWAVGFAAIFYETGLNGDARMAEIGRRTFARLEADAR